MTNESTTSARATHPSWFHARGGRRKRVCILLTALCIPAVAIPILALRGRESKATPLPLVDLVAADPDSPWALVTTRAATSLQVQSRPDAPEKDAQARDAEARVLRDHRQNDGSRVADPDRP